MPRDEHQAFYDRLAAEWDLMYTAEDLEMLQFIVDKRLKARPGMDVLDLGCGTGILFDLLRRKVGASGSVTGVDFSFNMAAKAHRNFPFPNVAVVDADATNLPFGDAAFDLAVVFSAFPHFADQPRTIAEIHRVLKPSAGCFIIHLSSSKEVAERHRRIGGVVARDILPGAAEMRRMLEDGRFTEVRVDDRRGLYVASATNTK